MKYCECVEPRHGEEWQAVGTVGNIVDLQICDDCGLPILGTATTHDETESGQIKQEVEGR